MQLVLDTHTLLWHLQDDPRLSKQLRTEFNSPANTFFIPLISIAELIYLFRRIPGSPAPLNLIGQIEKKLNAEILPVTIETLLSLPDGLEMHDGMIVAATLRLEQLSGEETLLATKDRQIVASGLVKTIW